MIINKYETMCPTFCNYCKEIYDTSNDMGAHCFLCERKMCPNCCPEMTRQDSFKVTLFPISFNCCDPIEYWRNQNLQLLNNQQSKRFPKLPLVLTPVGEKAEKSDKEDAKTKNS